MEIMNKVKNFASNIKVPTTRQLVIVGGVMIVGGTGAYLYYKGRTKTVTVEKK